MSEMVSFRFAGALGLALSATFSIGLVTFASFPTTGVALPVAAPLQAVNRTLKGDRLPVAHRDVPRETQAPSLRSRAGSRIPLGCDGAFSPVSAPSMALVYRRCMV